MKTKLLIFGITGDLSQGKLLPALGDLVTNGQNLQIIGVSRRPVELEELLEGKPYRETLEPITSMFTMNLEDKGDYQGLKDYINLTDQEQLLVYLAVPPNSATQIASFVAGVGLNGDNVKVLFEKPFGLDLTSAREMVDETLRHFKESQIYRVDHYLAKEVANEILRLRSNADNHHHHWGNQSISSVEVITSEILGVGSRAASYEQTGALRDFIQCHNIQLASLVLMDIPPDFEISKLSDYRLRALSGIRPADSQLATRAQYEGYQAEVNNMGSLVETFANVQLESGDENWQGIPVTLVTGKRLDAKRSQIIIKYKDGSQDIFDEDLLANGKQLHSAYERVLQDAIDSNKSIFTSSQEVIASWIILQPILDAWEMTKTIDLYEVGATIEDVVRPSKLA